MKKVLVTTIVTALLALAASAFAQTPLSSKSHGVTVTIPNMAYIRMTSGASNADVAAPDAVEFVFDATTYGVGTFSPTNASFNWDDIKVWYNGTSAWEVVVSTTGAATFAWNKIAMTPTGTGTSPFDLGGTYTVVSDTGRTTGWRSLGIDPANYLITLDGLENPGAHAATVTFTLQNP